MTIAELMIPELEREAAITRRVLALVPAERIDWKPHETLHTIGWNANHLAEIVGWTGMIIAADEFDIQPPGAPKYAAPDEKDPGKILATFDRNLAAAREAFQGVSDEAMARDWTMKWTGQPLFTLKKGDCLRTWVLNHSVHHRGILSVYLRMAGVQDVKVYD